MSEQTKPTSTSKDSASSSKKTPSKPDTAKASDSTASDNTASDNTASDNTASDNTASDSTSSNNEPSTTSKSDSGKSSRDSVGGAGAVHYGFFSNVKTPKYRSGWDDIWDKDTKPKKKKPTRAKEPVLISLAMDELPEEVQASLAEVVRARLKKSRINLDNRAKAGAVTWRIDCQVKR